MQNRTILAILGCLVMLSLLSCSCSAAVAVLPSSCGPDEVGVQSKFRNLCLFYNGLLKQQAYDNMRSELPMNRFVGDSNENAPSDVMIIPAGENHYTNGGVKRQDVDHVFLRFGRRR